MRSSVTSVKVGGELTATQRLIATMQVGASSAADVFRHLSEERQHALSLSVGFGSAAETLQMLRVAAIQERFPYLESLGAPVLQALVADLNHQFGTHHVTEGQVLEAAMRLSARDANEARQAILSDKNQLSFRLNASMRELQTMGDRIAAKEAELVLVRNELAAAKAEAAPELVTFLKEENQRLSDLNRTHQQTILNISAELAKLRAGMKPGNLGELPPEAIEHIVSAYSDMERLVAIVAKRLGAEAGTPESQLLYVAQLHAQLLEQKLQRCERILAKRGERIARLKQQCADLRSTLGKHEARITSFRQRQAEMRTVMADLVSYIEGMEAKEANPIKRLINVYSNAVQRFTHRFSCAVQTFKTTQ